MAARREGEVGVEEVSRPGDHFSAPYWVVGAGAVSAIILGDDIGAVERIVQTAPPGVDRIEGKARVHHRHHQLGACNLRDLRIHILGRHRNRGGLWQQVANFFQKPLIRGLIFGFTGVVPMPGVQLGLESIAGGQQRLVAGHEVPEQFGQRVPKIFGADSRPRGNLVGQ